MVLHILYICGIFAQQQHPFFSEEAPYYGCAIRVTIYISKLQLG